MAMASVPDSTGDVRQLDLQCAKHDVVAPFGHGEVQRDERRRADLAMVRIALAVVGLGLRASAMTYALAPPSLG
jgi:hypothetical protein